jgi:hypothetical protein
MNARIEEFDLKSPIFYLTRLPDELIETRPEATRKNRRLLSLAVAHRE